MSSTAQAESGVEPTLTVFMLVKTQPLWLSFTVEKRFAEGDKYIRPILQKHASEVKLRMFDTEFYATRVTDLWMWETTSRHAYELVVEELRETPFWDNDFSIVELLPAVENAAAKNYQREPLTA
jgi:hypothetical protein